MGQEDDVNAALAHVILSCVAARGTAYRHGYSQPGMHVNLFVHGVVGFLHYQSCKGYGSHNSAAGDGSWFIDLAVRSILADPIINIVGGKFNNDFGPAYILSHKASRYLPLPCLMADIYRGNRAMCALHLASGILPFALAITQQDNPELGNTLIACNIVSLCYYSFENGCIWGWYTAGAAIIAYFFTPKTGQPLKVIYPLCLALMEYCAYNVFRVRIDASRPPAPRTR